MLLLHGGRRRGLAVFPSREGLYRYLAWKSDLDADHGVLLIFPDRVVSVEPLDSEWVDSIRIRVGEEKA